MAKENDWFGKDEEMTSLALGLHEKLVKQNGVAYATTDEYYDRINDTMRKRFPEHFDSESAEVETKETTKAKPAAVVAPVSRTTSSKRYDNVIASKFGEEIRFVTRTIC